MFHKRLAFDMTLSPGDRSFIAKISTDALDRDGEVLLPQGMDASDFEKNPIVFFNHEHKAVPVGQAVSLRQLSDHWLAKIVMDPLPPDHLYPKAEVWLPDVLLWKIQQRTIRGISVGFLPIEERAPTKRDRERFGQGVRKVFSKWKLLEISIAPLPANQDALIVAVSKHVKASPVKTVTVLVYAKAAPLPVKPVVSDMIGAAVRRELDRRRGVLYSV